MSTFNAVMERIRGELSYGRKWIILVGIMALAGCDEEPMRAVGQLESDRIELIAEANETIIEISVNEGDRVRAGQPLLQLDDRRLSAEVMEASANLSALEARLAELIRGPRKEKISAVRATLFGARKELEYRRKELKRLRRLAKRNLTAEEKVDEAHNALNNAQARYDTVRSELAELESGTTAEELEQARQQVEGAKARVEKLMIDVDHLKIKAPVDGTIDSIPFELGEQPPAGQIAVIVLANEQPRARVYVPEAIRVNVHRGDPAKVYVDGLVSVLEGTVIRVDHEASFTPYQALTRYDRGRLTYVAKIELPETEKRLPDGVPVEVEFLPSK